MHKACVELVTCCYARRGRKNYANLERVSEKCQLCYSARWRITAQHCLSSCSIHFHFYIQKAEVKLSLYRPGQALRFPGGWGSHFARQLAHECGMIGSPTHRLSLPLRKYSWCSFLLETESPPGSIVRPSGLCQWYMPIRTSGIEPVTFRLVSQCLNQLRHIVPPVYTGCPTRYQNPAFL